MQAMKVTKQKIYQKQLAQRALEMEAVVELVKSEKTKEEVGRFRERLRCAQPNRRYTFTQKLPQLLFAGTFRKDVMKEYNGWVLLEVNRLGGKAEAESLRRKIAGYPADAVRDGRVEWPEREVRDTLYTP